MSPEAILSAYEHPAALAEQAAARRDTLLGRHVRVRVAEPLPAPAVAARMRAGTLEVLHVWPLAAEVRAGDHVVVQVDPTHEARTRYLEWLQTNREIELAWSLAPFSADAAGVHRLWCIAAARLCLPGTVRIEVRHDLVGLRLAQLALGFGADTLTGPVEPDRKLPLAGISRPTESTAAGLFTLIEQTGLVPDQQLHA